MWPFSAVRIFRNRWWALAFAAFVCWQAADFVGTPDASVNNTDGANVQAVTGALDKI